VSVPLTRSLPFVLREALHGHELKLMVATAVSAPDTNHVRVDLQGTQFTIPRLKSYNPVNAGDPVFILAGPALLLAIGSVK